MKEGAKIDYGLFSLIVTILAILLLISLFIIPKFISTEFVRNFYIIQIMFFTFILAIILTIISYVKQGPNLRAKISFIILGICVLLLAFILFSILFGLTHMGG